MKDCNNCKHKDCWEYAEPCSSCTNMTGDPTNWEPQTNYDLLISKTQEELAEKMVDYSYCPPGTACKPTCKECWLSWLKSPVEVSDGQNAD